ncbi:PepSY-like domain-containing protein [Campylobacter troglodytis]|uniref:PepSY-like domain-containing protein n=1 Tax=Campylobacter troglodytis TaxID=654363 RepID=UPI003D00707B
MIQRLVFIFLFVLLSLKADLIISSDALPERIKSFIQTHFKAQIALVQMDKKSYEIYLTDGTELEFDTLGNWKEIESKLSPISFSILPANIASIIQKQFPQAILIELERKINYYKIKLSNGIKLKIDANGTILSQKF